MRAKSASPGDHEAAEKIRQQAAGLRQVEQGANAATESLTRMQRVMEAGKKLTELGREGVGAFIGGAVDGPIGGLLGAISAGSLSGIVGAVGTIIGMATKMAYTFEGTATRAALQLSVGTGGNLGNNIKMLKDAANQGLKYNISAPEMMNALATYGEASGSTVKQTAEAAPTLGLYSKAYGMTADEFAQKLGPIVEASGDTLKEEAKGIMGVMEAGGALGRSESEFIAMIPGIQSALQAQSPGAPITGVDASGFISSISAAGSTWAAPQTIQAALAAMQTLSSPAGGNMMRMAAMQNAGLSASDILTGQGGMNASRAVLSQLVSEYGVKDIRTLGVLVSQGGMSFSQAGLLQKLIEAKGGGTAADPSGAITAARLGLSGSGPGDHSKDKPQKTEEQIATERFEAYAQTLMGTDERVAAHLENLELQLGTKVLDQLSKSAKAIDELFSGNFKDGIRDLIGSNEKLLIALGIAAVASTLGPAALPVLAVAGTIYEGTMFGIKLNELIHKNDPVMSKNRNMNSFIDALEMQESTDGKDPRLKTQHGADSIGLWQLKNATAADMFKYLPDTDKNVFKDYRGLYSGAMHNGMFTEHGRQLLMQHPEIQRHLALLYASEMQRDVVAHGGNANDFREIAARWNVGSGAFNKTGYATWNYNHTAAQYADQVVARMPGGVVGEPFSLSQAIAFVTQHGHNASETGLINAVYAAGLAHQDDGPYESITFDNHGKLTRKYSKHFETVLDNVIGDTITRVVNNVKNKSPHKLTIQAAPPKPAYVHAGSAVSGSRAPAIGTSMRPTDG